MSVRTRIQRKTSNCCLDVRAREEVMFADNGRRQVQFDSLFIHSIISRPLSSHISSLTQRPQAKSRKVILPTPCNHTLHTVDPILPWTRHLSSRRRSTKILIRSLRQARLLLRLARNGIVGNTTEPVPALTASCANRVGRRRLAERAAALSGRRDVRGLAARAHIDGAGVGRVKVRRDRGLLGKRQVRLDVVNRGRVGLHVCNGGSVALLRRNHVDCVAGGCQL